ncbi:phosphoribosyltransferase family protein [Wenyingzhuangia sp. chi5]|uniref:Phosphoribosyltransferase family protein n=1 Tax=Wenyingzhuangia gilva TaxID=3057677 RepID=A0ABT8VPC4_9FLAO|nr:phosphoribosyltransferase family protein [Wenyingzhuangia sp. chi5]MDO3693814.1 phosphoribosyltransferase family protein [Wenyingzhuangia sp. chi5]
MNPLKDLRDLFVPYRCLHCKSIIPQKNSFLCVECHQQLEFTNFINYQNNPLEKLFLGKVVIVDAAALYFYQKNSPIQTLLKALKYHGLQDFGQYAAKAIVDELEISLRFKNIDIVIPVPLHPKKEKKRGYNQVDVLAKSIAKNIQAKYVKDGLIKTENNKSQTKQNKEERHKSVQSLFKANPKHSFHQKNILLIDDVLTTGATLISCAKALRELNNVKISIITIACVV